jgi:hypothetical protein
MSCGFFQSDVDLKTFKIFKLIHWTYELTWAVLGDAHGRFYESEVKTMAHC